MADAVEIGYRSWRRVEFVGFVGSIEFVELIKTETRRLVETNRDTIEIQWRFGDDYTA